MTSEPYEAASTGPNDLLENVFLESVLFAVATQERCDIADLPPLYRTIDPERMELILDRGIVDSVTFGYCGYEVTVTTDEKAELVATTAPEETTTR